MNRYTTAFNKAVEVFGKPIIGVRYLREHALRIEATHDELLATSKEMARQYDKYVNSLERGEQPIPPTRNTAYLDIEANHAKLKAQSDSFITMMFTVGGLDLVMAYNQAFTIP